MRHYTPEKVIIERSVRDSSIAHNVLSALPTTPVEFIDSVDVLVHEARRDRPTIAGGKQDLVLARHRGGFFKPCPAGTTRAGSRNVCCNYFVVSTSSNCHMECSYCYLQTHLNFPQMVVYANHGDLLDELDEAFRSNPRARFRVGTGELADSLALDPLTRYSVPLVEFFADVPNAVLELKTKSNCVENLLDLDHRQRTVVSWSVNPDAIQRTEEHKTATLDQRLAAAEKCSSAGYPVAFHFDPILHYPGWENDYRGLVEEVFTRFTSDSIAWVSLGALRMTPRLKGLIRDRFPSSRLPLGELVATGDGKLRYFKPLRVDLLGQMRAWIREAAPGVRIYACMEDTGVWGKVFPGRPPAEVELGDSLLELLI